jgi:hypothetical protein
MEFTADIPSYEFTVNKDKLNKQFSVAKKSNPPVFDLPQDSKWKDITIKFRDEDKVEILLKGKHFAYSDYKKMRFGKKRPDNQWGFLKWLAGVYAGSEQLKDGRYIPASVDNFVDYLRKNNKAETRENVHTIRRLLSRQLQEDFEIYDDPPFDDYDKLTYYKTNFTLISEPSLRWAGNEGVWSAGKKFNDAVSYENGGNEESTENLADEESIEDRGDEADV